MIQIKKSEIWPLAQEDLEFFSRKILKLKWPPHYDDWYGIVKNHLRAIIQCPRGHGKSTFWSFALPIWDAIRGAADVILVSYSEDQVRRLLRNIRIEIESNDLLSHIRPSTREVWGTDMLAFADGGKIMGLGFGTSSRGLHPKRIIVDDPLKDMGGMTAEDQERAYFGVITGMAMGDTTLYTIGTPVDFDDLLIKLEQNPAYHSWRKPALDPDGNALFPELFTKDVLEQRRSEMGSINFAREFMLERIDPSTQPFKMEFAVYYDECPFNFARTVTVCDPAYTEGEGDATAIVTVSFTHGNHAYVRQAKEIRKEDIGQIVHELTTTIDQYHPGTVGIEKRKGEALSYSFEEWRNRNNRWDFSYVPLSHGGLSKGARANMVGGLIPRWEARTVHVHKSQSALLQQLQRFRFNELTKGHDDLVDALAYCFHPDLTSPNTGKQYGYAAYQKHKTRPLYWVGKACQGKSASKKILEGTL